MTGTMPSAANTIAWWELQEVSGNRIDKVALRVMTDNATVTQGTGHVMPKCADFERDNSEFLDNPDAAWNTFGNESVCMWAWFKIETDYDPMTLFSKFNESNDHEYGAWLEAGRRPYVGIARGGHVWETTAIGGAGLIAIGTWYLFYYYYDASADSLGLKIYDTTGALTTSGAAGNVTGFGASGDNVTLQIGRNEPGGAGSSNFWDGLVEQFAMYQGLLTANELTWVVNGGAGRRYSDLLPADWQIWYSKMRDWFEHDGSLHNGRIIEELWKQNQRLKGEPECLPI